MSSVDRHGTLLLNPPRYQNSAFCKPKVDALNHSCSWPTASNMRKKYVEIAFSLSWACFSSHSMAITIILSDERMQLAYPNMGIRAKEWLHYKLIPEPRAALKRANAKHILKNQLLKLGTPKWMQPTLPLLWDARSWIAIEAPSQTKIKSGIPSISSPKEQKLEMLSWRLSSKIWLNAWTYFSTSCWVIATWKVKPFGHPV